MVKSVEKPPEGKYTKPLSGSQQGGIISPGLANIYLHYVLDLWFEKKVKPAMRGRCMMIRYADDFVCAFQFARDAERFYKVLPKRLKKFNSDVAEDKTSLMRFSRFHAGRKCHFVFLGFEFYWGTDAYGKARLSEFYQWIKAKRLLKLREWLPQLKRKLIRFRITLDYPIIVEAYRNYTVMFCIHYTNGSIVEVADKVITGVISRRC